MTMKILVKSVHMANTYLAITYASIVKEIRSAATASTFIKRSKSVDSAILH